MADASQTQAEVHPHLRGNLAPVRTEDDFELEVRGAIPDALRGAYYRNGPNPQFDPGPDFDSYHSFIGDGMIHGFWLEGDRARYANRYVRTPRWLAEHDANRRLFGGIGQPRDASVENVIAGTANTNIIHHAGKLLALQEGSNPFELERATLASKGWVETGGRFTAHPKKDPKTGELVWFAYFAGEQPLNAELDYGVTDAQGKVLRRDRFQAPYASMVHDFFVTEHYVLFPILPLTGDLARAMKGLPPIAWEPDKGAYLGVMKRDASVDSIRWYEVDPCYVFHPMNAWEDGDTIHCELLEYPCAPLFPNADGSRGGDASAKLTRWSLDLANGQRVKRTQLDDVNGEFPRFDERFAGLPYRYGWYAANTRDRETLEFDSLVLIDHQTGKRSIRQLQPGETAGEPVFVPRSATAPEGDGYVLATIHSQRDDRSCLAILDAQNITAEPAALLYLPRRVPAGFHGNWVQA